MRKKRASPDAPDRPDPNAALLHDVLDCMPQGVIMFSNEGRMLYCNRRYLDTYGFSEEDLRPGITMESMVTMRNRTGVMGPAERKYCKRQLVAMRKGLVQSGFHPTPDGRTIHYVNTPIPSGGWIVTHEDMTQQRQAEQQIEHMASHDALTDLPNRLSFQSHVEQALRLNPRGTMLAVMFMDLDNFKGINDTLGHQLGDELLKIVAKRLRSCMRETDMVARFGGDEFVIVSSGLDSPARAAALATRIREAVLEPYDLADNRVSVDISIGISLSPNDGTDAEQLLKNADQAPYCAKGSGRGTYRFFEGDMDVRTTERHNLELDLRAGFVNGEFEIHYQPLVNLESGRVSCCEALLRWNHPVRGSVPPDVFIPVAEEIGLITRLGEWVIRIVCAEAVKWPEQVTVAINVSPVQFRTQNLLQIITHALAASGLAPGRLELEITEAILLDQAESTLTVLRQLQALGVRIAMDDFGTGYSSLSYLRKFPFDKIKIDQCFIQDLSLGGAASAIVRAVTGIADSFHMVTTAEGVETEEQRMIVKALGCTEMQGHLFSKAIPAAEILALLMSKEVAPSPSLPDRLAPDQPGADRLAVAMTWKRAAER